MGRARKLSALALCTPPAGLEVKELVGPVGRAVYATRDFACDEVLELSPVLTVRQAVLRVPEGLRDFYFVWPGGYAVGLGYLSLYNHSYSPNAVMTFQHSRRLGEVRASRPIAAGEEVRVNYAGTGSTEPVGFEVV